MHARQIARPIHRRAYTLAELRQPMAMPTRSTAGRMADLFVSRAREGFDDTTQTELLGAGFTEADIIKYYDAANAEAGQRLRVVDVNDERATYDRQARVMLGAVAIAGQFNPSTVNTALHLAGLTTREIGNLFDDIVGEALRQVREGREALGEAH